MLDDLAVQACSQIQPLAAGRQRVRGDESGAEDARAVEVLAHGPLRRSELIVPHGDVVEYRISGDMVECLLTRNVPYDSVYSSLSLAYGNESPSGTGMSKPLRVIETKQ